MSKILIVEDDVLLRDSIEIRFAEDKKHQVVVYGGVKEALDAIEKESFDLVITDMLLPEEAGRREKLEDSKDKKRGLEIIKAGRKNDPNMAVIVMTAYLRGVDDVVEAMRLGAWDYIDKVKCDTTLIDELRLRADKALEERRLKTRYSQLQEEVSAKYSFHNIIGQSKAMQEVFEKIRLVAPYSVNVLISGENGTGKDLVAKAIHYNSPRREGPFIEINCATLPKDLVESELFGHEVGAFTGATRQKLGKFEVADGGTLLLNEVGEIPFELQPKLLRVLENKEFERVGGNKTIKVNVRVIAATNRDIAAAVANGSFREDLLFRLNVFPICLTPLRDRKDDIPLLAVGLIEKIANELKLTPKKLVQSAIIKLQEYDWPGNVRELENVLTQALISAPKNREDIIQAEDIPLPTEISSKFEEFTSLEDLENKRKEIIIEALKKAKGSMTEAARILGAKDKSSFNSLRGIIYRFLKDNNIDKSIFE